MHTACSQGVPPVRLVVTLAVKDPKDSQEQIDNIQVKRDGRGDLLFDVIVSDDQLRVHKDVATEDERRNDSIAQLDLAAVREKHGHETKEDKHPQCSEEVRHPAREIVLRLAGEECEGDENAKREQQCFEDDLGVVERRYNRDSIRLSRSEGAQEHEVSRV